MVRRYCRREVHSELLVSGGDGLAQVRPAQRSSIVWPQATGLKQELFMGLLAHRPVSEATLGLYLKAEAALIVLPLV
jgi:hypothetical protein